MKILCLSRAPLDYKAGIPSYCLNLYSGKNFNVLNLSYDLNNALSKSKKRIFKGVKEIVYPSQFVMGTFAFSMEYLISVLKNSYKFDAIHIQHPDPFSTICSILSKIINPKIKLFVTWHAEIYIKYFIFSPFLLLIDFFLFLLSSKIIFFTPLHLKNSILNKINFLRKKAILIPFAFDFKSSKNFKNNKKDFSINKSKITILSIGRLVDYKGYEYAIRALNRIDEKVIYKIVGNGPLMKKLKKLIVSLNLKKRVFLMGSVSENKKNKLLDEADIFLFPSISASEAYGLVQLEAMASSLPIINTNLKNGVNYLAPNDIAITCRVKSSQEIFNAINKLIKDNNFYKKKSNDSYKNLSRFNHEKMIKIFNEMLNEI